MVRVVYGVGGWGDGRTFPMRIGAECQVEARKIWYHRDQGEGMAYSIQTTESLGSPYQGPFKGLVLLRQPSQPFAQWFRDGTGDEVGLACWQLHHGPPPTPRNLSSIWASACISNPASGCIATCQLFLIQPFASLDCLGLTDGWKSGCGRPGGMHTETQAQLASLSEDVLAYPRALLLGCCSFFPLLYSSVT